MYVQSNGKSESLPQKCLQAANSQDHMLSQKPD